MSKHKVTDSHSNIKEGNIKKVNNTNDFYINIIYFIYFHIFSIDMKKYIKENIIIYLKNNIHYLYNTGIFLFLHYLLIFIIIKLGLLV